MLIKTYKNQYGAENLSPLFDMLETLFKQDQMHQIYSERKVSALFDILTG